MVALQPPGEPVLDQPGGAARTLHAVAAGAAQGQRRIAAAVQEEQHLLAGFQGPRRRLDQRGRQETAGRQPLPPHVEQFDLRQRRFRVAARQMHPVVASAPDIDHRFQRRRRRYQHDRDPRHRGAQHRHVARLIGNPVILLV